MIKKLSENLAAHKSGNQKLKIAIIRSNYHQDLTESLEKTCRKHLTLSGIKEKNITTYEVLGSWEIPLITKRAAISKKFDGIIAFGIIIKGETYHFELIANECARALMNIALELNTPVVFEVLAVFNLNQAKKRTTGKYNKGIEAAKTLLSTIETLSKL